jgi:hypothetical protein
VTCADQRKAWAQPDIVGNFQKAQSSSRQHGPAAPLNMGKAMANTALIDSSHPSVRKEWQRDREWQID